MRVKLSVSASDVPAPSGPWHVVSLNHRQTLLVGSRFRALLNFGGVFLHLDLLESEWSGLGAPTKDFSSVGSFSCFSTSASLNDVGLKCLRQAMYGACP